VCGFVLQTLFKRRPGNAPLQRARASDYGTEGRGDLPLDCPHRTHEVICFIMLPIELFQKLKIRLHLAKLTPRT
jgi:hypothetical protein